MIQVERLGKRYAVGERERYLALRDVFARLVKAPVRNGHRQPREFVWALKDVSFSVREGKVVGLIGRNGAGKTTLLKLLARITRPTEGHAEIHGRVGSLLEVGTGFHPELTGRENVFLSGAILGMKKKEIERKFDEIVAFAEVERFIDTPLKHYSNGMQTRLAFAVAAHLEPEILLVDEVLAVGDAEFQKKCLGKMGEVTRNGRTIVFVSHQMNQIRRICEDVVWIDGGCVRQIGSTEEVISAYESNMASRGRAVEAGTLANREEGVMGWEVLAPRGTQFNSVATGQGRVVLSIHVKSRAAVQRGHLAVLIYHQNGLLLSGWAFNNLQMNRGMNDLILEFPILPLRPGAYELAVNLQDDGRRGQVWNLTPSLLVEGVPVTHYMDEWAGILNIPCSLESRSLETVREVYE
jgi:ABC-type polysaccharide/polyol phosphate transport system ATPase subunit